jgi:hypothetical protein
MIARRQAAVQPGRYGPRSAARGLAVSFTVSIMARVGRGQNGSCGRAAQRRRTGAEPRVGPNGLRAGPVTLADGRRSAVYPDAGALWCAVIRLDSTASDL